ncbi:MAG: choice-of-anchor J domain-containing protein [Bacteroidota bacterium]
MDWRTLCLLMILPYQSLPKYLPHPLPTGNDFETSLLRPGWSISNPDGDITWVWAIPGASGVLDTATAINNYDYFETGEIDDIRTTVINTSALLANDSLLISFDLAHKNYPGSNDVLQVLVSTDCGTTFTNVWERAGAVLATAGSSNSIYDSPVPADWVKQKISLGQNLFGGGQIIVVFRNINDFGNVVWLDNINISIKPRKDIQALTIVRPNATECTPPFAPALIVRNNGDEVVTGFKTGYILDGGTPVIQGHNIPLATGVTATLTFPKYYSFSRYTYYQAICSRSVNCISRT